MVHVWAQQTIYLMLFVALNMPEIFFLWHLVYKVKLQPKVHTKTIVVIAIFKLNINITFCVSWSCSIRTLPSHVHPRWSGDRMRKMRAKLLKNSYKSEHYPHQSQNYGWNAFMISGMTLKDRSSSVIDHEICGNYRVQNYFHFSRRKLSGDNHSSISRLLLASWVLLALALYCKRGFTPESENYFCIDLNHCQSHFRTHTEFKEY